MGATYESWGRYPSLPQTARRLHWRQASLPVTSADEETYLPFGNGRSYGDSCLTNNGVLLDTRGLDRFIMFNPETGRLRCEAGVLLADILALVVPQGWFLPVTPGTKYVTLGGAIANDVHGKNHHCAGTFGCHVRCFELLRSDGQRFVCSPTENAEWFCATVGGLGLTGIIVWAEIALQRIAHPAIYLETIRFPNLAAFFELSASSDRDYKYTVAWIDCAAKGPKLGRGLFMRGNQATALCPVQPPSPQRRLHVPLVPPLSLVNGLSLRLFNTLYYYKQSQSVTRSIVHYEPFFYPLDAIGNWNRIYGPRGFLQYQCVVPPVDSQLVIRDILQRIASAGSGSFLAVLKIFGDKFSPGLLSFPRPGVTLALDFPFQGNKTLNLLEQLDGLVAAAGGAIYPAKDARLSAARFRQFFPNWKNLLAFKDPRFMSNFWHRVTQD